MQQSGEKVGILCVPLLSPQTTPQVYMAGIFYPIIEHLIITGFGCFSPRLLLVSKCDVFYFVEYKVND